MWYEALPSMAAMLLSLSLVEIGPFVTHYASWGCPMMRGYGNEIGRNLQLRDDRIARDFGQWGARHMYTYGLSTLDAPVKESGNFDHYVEAEKKLTGNQTE